MQIFQWLFKVTHDDHQTSQNNNRSSHSNTTNTNGREEYKSRNIVLYENCGFNPRSSSKRGKYNELDPRKNFKLFTYLYKKDVVKACFYSTLKLRRIGSVKRRAYWIHSMKMKKEDTVGGLITNHRTDSGINHVGNKVLPINETTVSPSNINKNEVEKKDNNNNDSKIRGDNKNRTISRMKELLRWAAATKSEKGGKFIGRKVLHFRNRRTPKSVQDDDNLSFESPKISLRWDVESCSTLSSTYSGISMASSLKNMDEQIASCNMLSLNSTPAYHDTDHCSRRRGNWITTDSEFVVLEL